MVWCKSRLSFCRHFLEEKNIYALAACEGNSTFLQRCFLSCKSEGHQGHPPRRLQTLGTQRHFNLFLTTRLVSSVCRAVGISLYGLEITGLWQHKEMGLDTGSVLQSFVHRQPFHETSVRTGNRVHPNVPAIFIHNCCPWCVSVEGGDTLSAAQILQKSLF